jgi:SynChlorMet cassette protein ScmC
MNRGTTRSHFRGYRLSLSDGNSWWITGDERDIRWIGTLAVIMGLEECAWTGSPRLIFSQTGKGSSIEWTASDHETMRIWRHNSIADIVCEVKNNVDDGKTKYMNMQYSLQSIYQQSICRGGLPFHAGLVELQGRGYLLAAPSNTGKSTCCRRLPAYWNVLCDDETLVVFDKQKTYRAHPFPTWSDCLLNRAKKTWNIQHSVPLCGVFFLEQSETDKVIPVGEGCAAVLMNEASAEVCKKFWRRVDRDTQWEFKRVLFNNACEMAKAVPSFYLHVSLRGKFWEKMTEALG